MKANNRIKRGARVEYVRCPVRLFQQMLFEISNSKSMIGTKMGFGRVHEVNHV